MIPPMLSTVPGVLAFAAEVIVAMVAVLVMLARGYRRYWATVVTLAAIVAVAILANAPIPFAVAIAAQLAFIVATTARLVWGRDPMGPQR